MTGREWGEGHEDLSIFDPRSLDAEEWVAILAGSGMRAVILTCKHHDGFCLWPSEYSKHTVAYTPWCDGNGDLVRGVSEACRKYGLKFGIYLSPWDRTESSYGEGEAYDDFYVHQLTELLTNYGEIGCVWLDGANGEGPSGKKQFYNWERYYEVIRRLQPGCVISVCGPDIRWVGNEAGQTRNEEWSVVPAPLRDAEKTAEKSQQADDGEFSRSFNSMEEDLGSRQAIAAYDGEWVWYPAEVNTSIRPGWFYHKEEDEKVRNGKELFEIYLNAVGGNATFLLNVPPDAQGRIAKPDRLALEDLGRRISQLQDTLLMQEAILRTSSGQASVEAGLSIHSNETFAFWQPEESDIEPWIELTLEQPQWIDTLGLGEHLASGQRIEAFEVFAKIVGGDAGIGEEWQTIAKGGIVGHLRVLRFEPVKTSQIRVVMKQYREFPTLSRLFVNFLHS